MGIASLAGGSRAGRRSTPWRACRGISRPGLALVTFFGQRANARFDPQSLTLVTRNRVFQPLGIVPFTPRFTSQQLDVREQVSAIFLFEEDLPVNDSFTISYAGHCPTTGSATAARSTGSAAGGHRARTRNRDTTVADSGR